MLVLEFKAYGKSAQFNAIDEALRTAKFVQNKCLRYWMDHKGVSRYDLNKYCAVLAASTVSGSEMISRRCGRTVLLAARRYRAWGRSDWSTIDFPLLCEVGSDRPQYLSQVTN